MSLAGSLIWMLPVMTPPPVESAGLYSPPPVKKLSCCPAAAGGTRPLVPADDAVRPHTQVRNDAVCVTNAVTELSDRNKLYPVRPRTVGDSVSNIPSVIVKFSKKLDIAVVET